MTADTPWNGYWDTLPEGHLFFPQEGEEAVRRLAEAVPLNPSMIVLDYGCGYGQAAAPLAPRVGTLYIWDHAEPMRRFAAEYLRKLPNVRPWQPDDTATRFDLIWVNSVVQYMTPDHFADVLRRLAAVLLPTGTLIVSDLIPPRLPFHSDLLSLARFSLRRRYFVRAFRRAFALRERYSAIQKDSPLYHPTREEMLKLAADAGLVGEYLPTNLTHFRGRETVLLKRATA